MNSTTIIDIPPRVIRPQHRSTRLSAPPANPAGFRGQGGEDELRVLARQIVDHDPALAFLLARAGERIRQS